MILSSSELNRVILVAVANDKITNESIELPKERSGAKSQQSSTQSASITYNSYIMVICQSREILPFIEYGLFYFWMLTVESILS